MRTSLLFRFCLPFLLVTASAFAQEKIMQPGAQFHGIRDYREVMLGVLYRGGANNGRAPLNRAELDALCDAGIGTAIYLYNTQFPGPSPIHSSKGSLDIFSRGGEGGGGPA